MLDVTRSRIAQCHSRYAEADFLKELVQRQELSLGSDHEDTLQSKILLQLALLEQGRDAEAVESIREELKRREYAFGVHHSSTTPLRFLLAYSAERTREGN